MKSHLNALNENFPTISKEIKKLLSDKFNIKGLNISEIHFSEDMGCPPGYEQVCKYYGKDPVTRKPIIKCQCVPK